MFIYEPLHALLRFEVFMAVTIFPDVMPYNPVDDYQCFGGIYCLHLQDRR
jgi:hypothetical protein